MQGNLIDPQVAIGNETIKADECWFATNVVNSLRFEVKCFYLLKGLTCSMVETLNIVIHLNGHTSSIIVLCCILNGARGQNYKR